MERLDSFYSEWLGCSLKDVKSGETCIVTSELCLHREGYRVIFPFLFLCSGCRYVISVRPDLKEIISNIIHESSDAMVLFRDDVVSSIESWCQDVIPDNVVTGLERYHALVRYVDNEHFRSFTVPECRRLTSEDQNLVEEMNKICKFGCPEESIKDGTAFGVIIDNKIVSRSSTMPTPDATSKYGLVWLSVETLPEYRQRGYAKAVVSGTTETILSRGQISVYSHATCNKASENTAKALGYQLYGEILRWRYSQD